ncbi:MAG: hypothetical protein ABIP41_07505 [Croceibacterium sp.]
MTRHGYWLLPALALAAACSKQTAEPSKQAAQLTFHEVMKGQVDKHADDLWDLSNKALGEKAGIDPAKMTDAGWTALADKSDAVQKAALMIVNMDPILVVKPGMKISDEGLPGGHTGAQVQARIDKDPQHLRDMANVLATHMGDLAKAARAHDAARAGPLVDQLDGVCEDCHLDYWYPDQKDLVNKFRNATS